MFIITLQGFSGVKMVLVEHGHPHTQYNVPYPCELQAQYWW